MSAYCHDCDRWFVSQHALQQHYDYSSAHAYDDDDDGDDDGYDSPVFECDTCTRDFSTQRAAEQHMDALGHWKYHSSAQAYDDYEDYDDDDYGSPVFECDTCTRDFSTQRAAEQHMDALGHWEYYCHDCQRKFQNENNLRQHLNSRTHIGRSILCPFCREAYTTASGLSHHLETGSCNSAPTLNRESIHRLLQRTDRNGVVTKRLLTYPTFEATNQTWNGYNYECYLCHREFTTISGLNQHLRSGAHQQKLYHCLKRSCGREFVSLAGLFQHLESESCGAMRFGHVQTSAVDMLRTGRLIGY